MTNYWKKQMSHGPTEEYYEILLKIVRGLEPQSVLEIGTGWGISGSAFLDAGSVRKFVTIDCNISAAYGKETKAELLTKVKGCEMVFVDERSENYLPNLIKLREQFDLVYVDGDHGYEGCLRDLEFAGQLTKRNILLDDYLHKKNYEPSKDKDFYGISRAVREYLIKTKKPASVYPTSTNGFLLI